MSESRMSESPLSEDKVINFMGIANPAMILSIILVLGSLILLGTKGLVLGLDFTGGTAVEVEYEKAPVIQEVRETLQAAGYENVVVQNFGADTSILVRLQRSFTESVGDEILVALTQDGDQVELVRSEFVGAQVGEELREQGGLGLLLALGMVMIYIAFRFQFKFAVGAVLALIHDVIITLGMFSLLGWEFDLNVLAAILAVIGYSLNDTIVVSDRIRENFRKLRQETPVNVINVALTQTLSRTMVTGITTLLVLLALDIFGGEALLGFSNALIIGIIVGTYSSIYIASAVLLKMGISSEDLMIPVKEGEGEEVDDRP